MSAPTPWSGPLPGAFTGQYLKRTPGVGNLYVGSYTAAEGGNTAFDALVNPPASGVAAEAASVAWATDVASTALTSPTHGKSFWTGQMVTNMVTRQFDFMRSFYNEASILRDEDGVPIA